MIFSATLPVTIWQLSCQSKASVLGNLPSNVQRLVRIFFCWEPSHLLFGPCLNRSATKLPSKAYVFGNLPWTVRQLRVARQMSLKSNPWCSASPLSIVLHVQFGSLGSSSHEPVTTVAKQMGMSRPILTIRLATESCQAHGACWALAGGGSR